jgi:site-specific DNA-cytosine methylase
MTFRFLDLFCGLGGWSKGFAAEGFEVTGVDITYVGYFYPIILQDIKTIDGRRFRGFDVIAGSPPCRDFTIITDHRYTNYGRYVTWKDPKNPYRGLILVHDFLRVIREAEPTYWIMENVPGLEKHLDIKPRFRRRLTRTMLRSFWGNFPQFTAPIDWYKPEIKKTYGPLAHWKRSEIPTVFSQALARSCREALEERRH